MIQSWLHQMKFVHGSDEVSFSSWNHKLDSWCWKCSRQIWKQVANSNTLLLSHLPFICGTGPTRLILMIILWWEDKWVAAYCMYTTCSDDWANSDCGQAALLLSFITIISTVSLFAMLVRWTTEPSVMETNAATCPLFPGKWQQTAANTSTCLFTYTSDLGKVGTALGTQTLTLSLQIVQSLYTQPWHQSWPGCQLPWDYQNHGIINIPICMTHEFDSFLSPLTGTKKPYKFHQRAMLIRLHK